MARTTPMHAHSTPFAILGTVQTFFRTVGEILLHPRRFFAAQFAPERVATDAAARPPPYFLLAAGFRLFSGCRLPVRSVMAYFAYVFGAMLVLDVVATLLGDLLFLALPGDWQSRTFAAGLVGDVAGLVRVAYILVFPALIFPALLGVPRATVIGATM